MRLLTLQAAIRSRRLSEFIAQEDARSGEVGNGFIRALERVALEQRTRQSLEKKTGTRRVQIEGA